jgi:hypothetical protein
MAAMAQGSPRARLAATAAAAGVGAAVLAGVASVAVQAGTIAGYALFVVLLAGALVLAASAVRLFTRARAAR